MSLMISSVNYLLIIDNILFPFMLFFLTNNWRGILQLITYLIKKLDNVVLNEWFVGSFGRFLSYYLTGLPSTKQVRRGRHINGCIGSELDLW